MRSTGSKSNNIKKYNKSRSTTGVASSPDTVQAPEIHQLTLGLDSSRGLDHSIITFEPVVSSGIRGKGIGAKVAYVNRSDNRFSQVHIGDVLHSINGQTVKTCNFTAIQTILNSCFQRQPKRRQEDDDNNSSSTKSSVVVVALTFLHQRTPAPHKNNDYQTDAIAIPEIVQYQQLLDTNNTWSGDNPSHATPYQQHQRHKYATATASTASLDNHNELSDTEISKIDSHQISFPHSKLPLDSPSFHETSQSFTREEVLHSIFSPAAACGKSSSNGNTSISFQSISPLQSPYYSNISSTNQVIIHEKTPQSRRTTSTRNNGKELSTTTKHPSSSKGKLLASIPEYVLDTSNNNMTVSPSFLTTDDESKVAYGTSLRYSSFINNLESPPNIISNGCTSISDIDPISNFLSPLDTNTNSSTTSLGDVGKSLSFSYSDTYLSPSSQVHQETLPSSQTVNITLEMFDVSFINNCHSPKMLRAIVSQLSTPTKKYPELLRLAKNRLSVLEQTTPSQQNINSEMSFDDDRQHPQLSLYGEVIPSVERSRPEIFNIIFIFFVCFYFPPFCR